MAATRTAHTVWNGDLMTGTGNTTLDSSGLGNFDVTWKARTEASEGKTSPEELIAAAHSACFSMAFSHRPRAGRPHARRKSTPRRTSPSCPAPASRTAT